MIRIYRKTSSDKLTRFEVMSRKCAAVTCKNIEQHYFIINKMLEIYFKVI